MNALSDLHQRIDDRVTSVRRTSRLALRQGVRYLLPATRRCAATRAEWEWLREGLATLPSAQLTEIHRRIATLGPTPQPPVNCPLLEPGQRGLPDYAHRPVACRTYGFYVQRDKGLHCARIAAQVEHGELADGLGQPPGRRRRPRPPRRSPLAGRLVQRGVADWR